MIKLFGKRILISIPKIRIDGMELPESEIDTTKVLVGPVTNIGDEVTRVKVGDMAIIEPYNSIEIPSTVDTKDRYFMATEDKLIGKHIKDDKTD